MWAMPLALAMAVAARSQDTGSRIPRFEDYPLSEIFNEKPSPPKLLRPGERLFRTRIREGAAKGPNFAGHYSIAEWGCGSSCVSIAVVDAKTGHVYWGPFAILGYGGVLKYADVSQDDYQPLSYKLNSRLFVVRGCPEDENCASYFYEWRRSTFRLLRKVPAVPIPR
jgi:hypothetical protein